MAIALVGQAGIAGGDQTSPIVISYSSSNGNTLVLSGFLYYTPGNGNPGISSITDTAGNTWNYSTSSSQNPPYAADTTAPGSSIAFVAWSINASPVTSVTLTMPNSSPWTRVVLSEWTGIAALDSSASATAASGTSATATVTLSSNQDLVIGAFENNSGLSFSKPSGWTRFTASGAVDNNAYVFPATTGSYSPAYTQSASTDWCVAFAAFKPAATSTITLLRNVSGDAPVSASNALTLNISTGMGHTLIAIGRIYVQSGGSVAGYPSITDSAGNTWHYATAAQSGPPPGVDFTGASSHSACWVAYCLNANTISSATFTAPASDIAYTEVNISEWSGIGSVGPSGTVTNLGGAECLGPALAVQTGDLMVGMLYPESGVSSLPQPTAYNGATAVGTPSVLNNSGDNVKWSAYQLFNASYTAVHWDWNGTTASIAVGMIFHQVSQSSGENAFMPFFM